MSSPQNLIDAVFTRAFALHAQHQLDAAAALYDALMEVAPDDPRAWHWAGVIDMARRKPQQAVDRISKAITLDGSNATCYLNFGNALVALERDTDAIHAFSAAIALRPDYVQAYLNLGNTFRRLRQYTESLTCYDEAISHQPEYAAAHFNRGNVLNDMGRSNEAVAAYDRALAINGQDADAWSNRGNALRKLGRFTESLESYRKVLDQQAQSAKAWSNHGLVLHDLGRFDEAITCFDRAISLDEDHINARCNKGNSLRSLKRYDEAMQCYEEALSRQPDHAQSHCNKGVLLRNMDQGEQALQSFNNAIQADPALAEAWSNRAMMHKSAGLFEASLEDQSHALRLKPDFADAWSNKGLILHDLKRIDEALVCFDNALAITPEHPEANWNKALDLILQGHLREGLKLYDWRLRKDGHAPSSHYLGRPRWQAGQDLNGKTLLVQHEQGYGDSIQFCRYTRLLEAAGVQVILEMPEPLVELMQSVSTHVAVVQTATESTPFDAFCSLMSLPGLLETDLDTIPAWPAYLSAPPRLIAHWQRRLPARQNRLRIGLAATGNPGHENTHNRDIPMAQLLQALPPGADYVLLQKTISVAQQADMDRFEQTIAQPGHDLTSFADTAAVCAHLDLIITVDTSVAHVAAAIGKPVWLLLPWVPDWRWFLDRTDSPWYPTVELFRQTSMADWTTPLEQIRSRLHSKVSDGP